jgi:signal transduction histidine kinase
MSLRARLSLILGTTFLLLWSLAALWMLCDLRERVTHSLDERLAASARMVAGLLQQLPRPQPGHNEANRLTAEQLGIPDGLACQVVSLRGEVLAQSHATPDRSLGNAGKGFHTQDIDGSQWRSFTLQVGDMWISTADRIEERELLNRSILISAAVPVVLALLGSLALLWLGVTQGLSPLLRIREAIARRGADSLDPLSLKRLPAELRPLVESQNQLFVRIASAIERERRFAGDAAHELRSPLTAIKTHLQVARLTTGKDSQQALAYAEQGADRLHRTLEQLLVLAKVEGSLGFDDGGASTVLEVVRHAVEDALHAQPGRIEVCNDGVAADQQVEAPAVLAILALRNLLENAMRHTRAGTEVVLELRTAADCLVARVVDQGPGVSAELLPRLTERFWRMDGKGGSGLGLAIVQAIVERCHGRLAFDSSADGLCATLELPLRR